MKFGGEPARDSGLTTNASCPAETVCRTVANFFLLNSDVQRHLPTRLSGYTTLPGKAPSKALQPPMPSQASLLDKCTTRRISARTCQM